ncbi:MAG: hypothetical protein KTR35_18490 [Gammaproteobacteria bacterium]|nr:hypothetical protein [Gammaproteobacteria bacterium]
MSTSKQCFSVNGCNTKLNETRKFKLSHLALAISQSVAIASTQAATLTVNTASEIPSSITCSLRDAVDSIDAGAVLSGCVNSSLNDFGVADTIQFSSYFNSPRTLNLNAEGEIAITQSVAINGPGEEQLIINAGGASRIFNVSGPDDTVNINNMTLINGSASVGGAIYVNNVGFFTLRDVIISGNSASLRGGGVAARDVENELVIDDVDFDRNYSHRQGGGLDVDASSNVGVSNSLFFENQALAQVGSSGGGGMLIHASESIILNNNVISQNTTGGDGGGILISSSSGTTIQSSVISNNAISSSLAVENREGGGIAFISSFFSRIEGSFIRDNTSNHRGGGISAYGSDSVYIVQTSISGNSAAFSGGGFYGLGTPSIAIQTSNISGNSSNLNGGGLTIRGGGNALSLRNSTVSRNTSNQLGGGLHIYSPGVLMDLVNNTISSNTTVYEGGGMRVGQGAEVELFSNTFTGNRANDGAGIFRGDQGAVIGLFQNNVIANSRSGPDCGNADGAPIVSSEFDWVEDGSCSREADGDPRLGSLRDNGGFSETHAPQPNSGLIGAGFNCQPTDQRGELRPSEGCIIGSLELVVEESGSIFVVPLPGGGSVIFEL